MNTHRSARTNQFSRALLVRRVNQEGLSIAEAADQAGISVRTAYKWLARARQEGEPGLADRSSRPFRMPRRTPRELERLIGELRGHRKTGAQIAEALGIPRTTAANVLKRLGLSKLPPVEPAPKIVRYEWPEPGDMVHLDVKKLARFTRPGHRVTGDRTSQPRGKGWEFVFVCVDDASRVAYVEVLPRERGPIAAGFLRRAAAWFAVRGVTIRRCLTDNGCCFKRVFTQTCIALGARHLKTKPYTPRTNGKAERFIQTMLREWAYARSYRSSALRRTALPGWLRYYNQHRAHGSLGTTPITRLRSAA
jgi:transposase InsO family protein